MSKLARNHEDLDVWKNSFEHAMQVFIISKAFPKEETYSLTDQIRRSSRAVSANISEARQKRRYQAHFISKLTDSAAEAAETQTWLRFAHRCGYMQEKEMLELPERYNEVLRTIRAMILHAPSWCTTKTDS